MHDPLHVCCDKNYFYVLEEFTILFLSEISQSSKYYLNTILSRKIMDHQSKSMALVMVCFGTLCDRMLLMFTIPRRNYHQYAAKLIFMW